MIVEPFAGDTIEQNFDPIGRLYYCASVLLCVSGSLAQDVGLALGAQAGEKKLSEVMLEAGFASVTRVAETPFNIILEARL